MGGIGSEGRGAAVPHDPVQVFWALLESGLEGREMDEARN